MSLSPVADKTQQQVKRIFIPAYTGGNLVPGHCTHVSPVPGAFSPHLMQVSAFSLTVSSLCTVAKAINLMFDKQKDLQRSFPRGFHHPWWLKFPCRFRWQHGPFTDGGASIQSVLANSLCSLMRCDLAWQDQKLSLSFGVVLPSWQSSCTSFLDCAWLNLSFQVE